MRGYDIVQCAYVVFQQSINKVQAPNQIFQCLIDFSTTQMYDPYQNSLHVYFSTNMLFLMYFQFISL